MHIIHDLEVQKRILLESNTSHRSKWFGGKSSVLPLPILLPTIVRETCKLCELYYTKQSEFIVACATFSLVKSPPQHSRTNILQCNVEIDATLQPYYDYRHHVLYIRMCALHSQMHKHSIIILSHTLLYYYYYAIIIVECLFILYI